VIIAPDTRRKVWKFHAENVHDFAFTADPTYRIGEASWNGIKCVALVQEPHASGWQNAASLYGAHHRGLQHRLRRLCLSQDDRRRCA
jgi:hypothetical protein